MPLLAALVVLGLFAAPGCQAPARRTVGISVEGRPIETRTLGHGPDTVLIMATIHGDESAGTPLLRRLADYLAKHPRVLQDRRVVLMPLVNPDGYANGTRHNVNGVDLNRNFPADNFDGSSEHGVHPLSEPESRAVKWVLDHFDPGWIVSVHQPFACIDYDGPAEELANAMAVWTDLPVNRVGSLPGSLGSYAGITRGTPIITLELPEGAEALDEDTLWQRYGKTLLAAVRYPD